MAFLSAHLDLFVNIETLIQICLFLTVETPMEGAHINIYTESFTDYNTVKQIV